MPKGGFQPEETRHMMVIQQGIKNTRNGEQDGKDKIIYI